MSVSIIPKTALAIKLVQEGRRHEPTPNPSEEGNSEAGVKKACAVSFFILFNWPVISAVLH
ncbi:MAG: hypothetical protein F6J92_39975 [Symploca sp. SIO1A3]|nr:hypothetical protein [Symploca sp. SIO1A3]